MKKTSKKVIGLTASALIAVSLLAACGNSSSASKSDSKTISNLKISFIPSKNPDDITTATKPIANILKSELKKQLRKVIDQIYEEYVGIHLKPKKFIDSLGDWGEILKNKESK